MYTSTYVNTEGLLKVFALYPKKSKMYRKTIAEVFVNAEDISKRYQEIVDKHFGNCDDNPVSYEFAFWTSNVNPHLL